MIASLAEFVYTKLLKPKPLRWLANNILRAIIPGQVRYDDVRIALNPRDPVVSGALFLRVYERDELCFIKSVVGPGMTVLDVGANIGFYTAVCGTRVGSQGRVMAVEPDQENFHFLNQTIQANGLKNVEVLNVAAGAKAGRLTLYTSSNNRGDNRLYNNDLADGAQEVPVVCLDDELESRGVEALDFLKVDVQGYEDHVLRGLERTLRRSKRLIGLVEFWPEGMRMAGTDPEHYLEELQSWGLKIEHLGRGGLATEPVKSWRQLIESYPGRCYGNLVLYGADARH